MMVSSLLYFYFSGDDFGCGALCW